jgi:flagellar biosynthetic protein FliR
MVLPGFGSGVVQVRVRLLLGLAIALLLLPVLGPKLPPLPTHPAQLGLLLAGEATVGVFLGMVGQFLLSALTVAGSFMSFQTGLTNAFSFDAVAQEQSQMLTGLLSTLAIVAVFAGDMHHLMLKAMVDSYDLFPPGSPLPLDDIAMTLSRLLSAMFSLGVRLAAPVLVFGMVFYAGLGLLSRMVPQMQVFFVATPLQVLIGLWMTMVALPVLMMLFMGAFQSGMLRYVAPG